MRSLARLVLLFTMMCVLLFAGSACRDRLPVGTEATATATTGPVATPTRVPTVTLAATDTSQAATETPVPPTPPPATATSAATPTALPVLSLEGDRRLPPTGPSGTLVIESLVPAFTRDRYLFWAEAGMELSALLSSAGDNTDFYITAPDGSIVKGGQQGVVEEQWTGTLPLTGDYVLDVAAISGDGDYRLALTMPAATPPAPTRVQFAAGETASTLRGRIGAGDTHRYVLRALAEQSLSADISRDSAVLLTVEGENGELLVTAADNVNDYWWFPALPATQDYIVSVAGSGAPADYTLTIGAGGLERMPTRVEFAPGTSAATLTGSLALGGDADDYIFRAQAGQTVRVSIETQPAGSVYFVYLQSADGSYIVSDEGGLIEAVLPQTGEYLLSVGTPNAEGAVEYTVQLAIE